MNTSVVSAAIIEGSLIIGLSDGSVINCGFVQGPQGLSGPQGPMGATGDSGTDGNTILTFAGTPGNEMGTDGDYAIDNVNWRIYGPKSGGVWGKAKEMLPGPENILENGRAPSGGSGGGSMGGSGSGGGGGIIYTNTVQLTNSTRTSFGTKGPYKVLPDPGVGRINQEDANNWAFGEVFDRIDEVLPVFVGPNEPPFKYTGRLWYDTDDDKLYIYDGNFWEPISGAGGGGGISGLETVNDYWTFVQSNPQAGQWRFKDNSDAYDGGIEIEIHKESKDGTEYGIEAFKVDNTIRIYNVDNVGAPTGNGELFAHLTAATVDSPSTYKLTYTIDEATFTAVGETHIVVAGAVTLRDLDDRYLTSVQDTPPAGPPTGKTWFDTEDDELTLYLYTGTEWVPAAPPVNLDGINSTINSALIVQASLVDTVTAGLEEQAQIKLDLEELQVTKGSVARYKITATNIGAAGRNGELYVMSPIAADVQAMSFAPFDLNGQPIKPCNPGDIIELVQATALASIGEVTRYRIVSGDSNALTVEYLSGTNNFEVDDTQEVYIYPQNEAGVSKDYVDAGLAGKLNNAGASDLANDTDWKVRQQNASGSNKTLLQIKAGELGVYNLKEPTQSHHAATKAYVDAKPSGGSGTGISASRPPGLKFNVSIVNLPNGYFQWWTNNSTNNQHLELATTDRDGIAWGTNTLREDVRYNDKIPFTIWEVSNNAWKMKVTGTISRIDFHPDRALCYVSSKTALNGGNFVNGAGPYYITISGLF